MTTTTLPRQRNMSLEYCKLIAACFVVFIHVPFPWPAGDFVLCLARFAVPLFFAISGWYSYRTESKKLLRRMGHVLQLELAGILIMLAWWSFAAYYTGRSIPEALLQAMPDVQELKRWLLWNQNPFIDHLWYLSASALCYGIFWIYSRVSGGKWGYRPVYILCAGLLCVHLLMGELSRYSGVSVHFKISRSGIFYGFPMFTMGLFLREHRDRLLGSLRTPVLVGLILFGTCLSLAEWKCFGVFDLYVGLLFTVSGILLLTCRYPGVPRWMEKMVPLCSPLSTGIYLVQYACLDVYLAFVQWRVQVFFGDKEPWLQPLGVLAMSGAFALGWVIIKGIWNWLLSRRQR